MHAWPALSTKRSRSGHSVSAGWRAGSGGRSCSPSGASAIAVPGWPALAFCTASIARPRIVSIDSLRISPSSASAPWEGSLDSTSPSLDPTADPAR